MNNAPLTVRQAAARLHALDRRQTNRNGLDLHITSSGGYGKPKQDAMTEDVRTLYAYVLGQRSIGPEAA